MAPHEPCVSAIASCGASDRKTLRKPTVSVLWLVRPSHSKCCREVRLWCRKNEMASPFHYSRFIIHNETLASLLFLLRRNIRSCSFTFQDSWNVHSPRSCHTTYSIRSTISFTPLPKLCSFVRTYSVISNSFASLVRTYSVISNSFARHDFIIPRSYKY